LAQAQLIMGQAAIYPDSEAVSRAAADYLRDQLLACVAQNGNCHIALPGGSTPGRCLELLSHEDLPWQNIHAYLGDERCLPVGHAERNDSMIQHRLWSNIDAPPENLHRIPAEIGPEPAAERYSDVINDIGRLDIALLGMGEDGHTASLFPGNAAMADNRAVVPVHNAPKAPADRVSLSLVTLQAAGQRVVLVTGANKRDAMMQIERGEPLPIVLIGAAHWFLDEAAADHARNPL
jgi:6-phosphogluconolactonase